MSDPLLKQDTEFVVTKLSYEYEQTVAVPQLILDAHLIVFPVLFAIGELITILGTTGRPVPVMALEVYM